MHATNCRMHGMQAGGGAAPVVDAALLRDEHELTRCAGHKCVADKQRQLAAVEAVGQRVGVDAHARSLPALAPDFEGGGGLAAVAVSR